MTRLSPIPVPDLSAAAPGPGLPLGALWRARWHAFAGLIAALLIGGIYAYYVATPIYRTHATLMLEPQEQTMIDLGAVLPGLGRDDQVLNSQVAVLRSRALVTRLVDELALDTDPEFNATLRPPPRFSAKAWVKGALVRAGLVPPPAPLPPEAGRNGAINALMRALDVTVAPDSLVFSVAVGTTEAAKSARIVNALTDLYIADQVAVKLAATDAAARWLSTRVVELQSALETAEARARSARAAQGLPSARDVAEMERRLDALRERLAGTPRGSVRYDALAEQTETMSAAMAEAANQRVQLRQLEREAEASRLLYESFLTRLKEISVQSGAHQPDARVLSPAVTPLFPARPKPLLILLVAAVLGTGGGLALGVAQDLWPRRVTRPDQVHAVTGLPLLAAMPRVGRARSPRQMLSRRPEPALVEAVRAVRAGILLADLDKPVKVILFASARSGEGRTTQCLLLARSLATWGKSVLVIEADVRKPAFLDAFGAPPQRGIVSVLAGLCSMEEAVLRPEGTNLDLLVGDARTATAADIFATQRFGTFLEDMRARYDYVLIDAPAALSTADARAIAPLADRTVFVAARGRARGAEIRQALAGLRSAGARVAGVVLNRARKAADMAHGA
ncbi:MAG: AAA family ATPase [Pseudomonadota bacterium]